MVFACHSVLRPDATCNKYLQNPYIDLVTEGNILTRQSSLVLFSIQRTGNTDFLKGTIQFLDSFASLICTMRSDFRGPCKIYQDFYSVPPEFSFEQLLPRVFSRWQLVKSLVSHLQIRKKNPEKMLFSKKNPKRYKKVSDTFVGV